MAPNPSIERTCHWGGFACLASCRSCRTLDPMHLCPVACHRLVLRVEFTHARRHPGSSARRRHQGAVITEQMRSRAASIGGEHQTG